MPDYQKLYHKLFNAITDTIEDLKNIQREAEEEYINSFDKESTEAIIKLHTKKPPHHD